MKTKIEGIDAEYEVKNSSIYVHVKDENSKKKTIVVKQHVLPEGCRLGAAELIARKIAEDHYERLK